MPTTHRGPSPQIFSKYYPHTNWAEFNVLKKIVLIRFYMVINQKS